MKRYPPREETEGKACALKGIRQRIDGHTKPEPEPIAWRSRDRQTCGAMSMSLSQTLVLDGVSFMLVMTG